MSPHVTVPPMTIVEIDATITMDELAARVQRTHAAHGPVLGAYHKVWYESAHTWHYCHFLGCGLMKSPNDLWVYQEIMTNHRPTVVIETGTYQGGSALWFAYLMDMLQIDGGRVFTIDLKDTRRCEHPRITFLGGDSIDPELVGSLTECLADLPPGPRLICLDSDHAEAHVRRELELYAPLAHVNDWLVVEDTNISWVGEGGDGGAGGGLKAYLAAHPGEFLQDIISERFLLTMNPGGWMRRVRSPV